MPRAQTEGTNFFLFLTTSEGTNVISVDRHTIPHSSSWKLPAARPDCDQHAGFFQGREPTQLLMAQREAFQSPNPYDYSITTVSHAHLACQEAGGLQLATTEWNGGTKGQKNHVNPLQLSSPVAAWKSMWYVGNYGMHVVHDEEFLTTHSTRVETPNPVAARFLSFHTGPAMSMCIHWTFSSTNCNKGDRGGVPLVHCSESLGRSVMDKNGLFSQSRRKGMSICYRASKNYVVNATPLILSL